jgi:hypothetical protein
MNEVVTGSYEQIVEAIKKIDTEHLRDTIPEEEGLITKVKEEQKVYFWVRVYLKEELADIQPGDDFEICYVPSGEKMITKFVAFGKKNLNRDLDSVIVNYDPEDDKKCLCIMVNEDEMKNSSDIPFIRTLFKTSPFFQYQVYRREQLVFSNLRTGVICDYIDCDF